MAANLGVVILGALRPVAEVGFYSIARGAATVLTTAVGPVSQSIYPLMNEAWTLKDRPRVRRLIGRLMTVNGIVSAASIVFLLFTAEWLVTVFYGPTFIPAAAVLRILIVAIGLRAVMGWMRQLILIAGYPRVDLMGSLIGTVFFLLGLAPSAYVGGAAGLAVLMILDTLVTVGAFAWLGSPLIRIWD
jgi:O-antigen/teichoic acid export membrane protein